MQSSSDLFELIKSLSRQEKRYFRLDSKRLKSEQATQYITLFDAIDSLEQYDEKLLRKKLRNETFLSRLSAVKIYLYNSILSSQGSFHSGGSVARILDEYMANISVLYRKALYAQCKNQIVKAKVIAKRHELLTRWLDLLEYEKNIHALRRFAETSAEGMNAILEEEKSVLAKIANTKNYYNKNARLVMLLHQRGFRLKESDKAEVEQIMDEDFRDPARALTFDAKLYYYNTNAAYGQASGNLQHSYEATKGYVQFLDSYPERIKEHPNRFVIGLSNFMISCSYLKNKQQDILDTIARLEKIEKDRSFRNEDLQLKIFLARYINEAVLSIGTCRFENADAISKGIERGLERFGESINKNDRLMLCYYLAYLYFGNEDFSNALKWNNRILHHFEPNVREDIQAYSRFLNILIHYEKGNVDLLEYELKSAYRFLVKRNRIFRFETVMMDFTRRSLSQPATKREIITQFQQLRDELIEVFKDPQEKPAEEYFDFVSWLDSKISNRKFAEVKKERLNVS